jgi:hypothetical protein
VRHQAVVLVLGQAEEAINNIIQRSTYRRSIPEVQIHTSQVLRIMNTTRLDLMRNSRVAEEVAAAAEVDLVHLSQRRRVDENDKNEIDISCWCCNCPSCGMALRLSPGSRKDIERLRQHLQRFR